MTNEPDKQQEELNKLLIDYQIIQQQIQVLDQYMKTIVDNISSIDITKQAINEVDSSNDKSKILFPLGSGVYASGILEDKSDVIVNIGAKTFVKRPLTDAISLLERKRAELQQLLENTDLRKRELSLQLSNLVTKIQHLQG